MILSQQFHRHTHTKSKLERQKQHCCFTKKKKRIQNILIKRRIGYRITVTEVFKSVGFYMTRKSAFPCSTEQQIFCNSRSLPTTLQGPSLWTFRVQYCHISCLMKQLLKPINGQWLQEASYCSSYAVQLHSPICSRQQSINSLPLLYSRQEAHKLQKERIQ